MIDWLRKATSSHISGSYRFHVKSDVDNPDISTTISVTAYTDRSESAMLPCHYKWFRIRNGLKEESYKFRGNSYVCDASDLGAIIQAEVVSNDHEYSGQANVQFGPVKLSPEIKKSIMDTLVNRSTLMRGFVTLGDYNEKECNFKIFEDMVKICHIQSDLNLTFTFTMYEPRMEVLQRDPTKIHIIFSQLYDQSPGSFMKGLFGQAYEQHKTGPDFRIEARFPNKHTRDVFLLTLKALYTKKQLINSAVIHKIEQTSFANQGDLNLMFEIESLRLDVNKLYHISDQKEREKAKLVSEVARLEREIEEIITTYTKMVEGRVRNQGEFNESFTVLTTKRDEVFGRKCENLERQNMNLNERIKLLTTQIDQIRLNASMAKRNQTIMNPNQNFTHLTTIRANNPRQLTTFDNILDQMSESRVTQFNEDNFVSGKKVEKILEEKALLEKKLEKSFRTIDDLEKKLKTQSSSPMQLSVVRKDGHQQVNTSSFSISLELQKMKAENQRLLNMSEGLKKDNIRMQSQIANLKASKPNVTKNEPTISVRESQLQQENENLRKQIVNLKQYLQNEQAKLNQLGRQKAGLQKRLRQVGSQLEMYRKNQQVLNRSQHLSMEMESYNDEQIRVLKEHNQVLLGENQKLSKAVEKYMLEARENIKLRKQILALKQRLNEKLIGFQGLDARSTASKSQRESIIEGSQILANQF